VKIPQLPASFDNETEVQFYYSMAICDLFKCAFTARFRTDGIYEQNVIKIKMLAEYKNGGDLKLDKDFLSRCVCQVLCYLKKIEDSGELLPNIIFIANDKYFTIFESSILSDYLHFVNGSMIPSSIFTSPPEELKKSLMDNFKVHIYSILDLSIIEEIVKSYDGKSRELKMSINNNNITRIFEQFITSNILNQKLSENENVALFASIIFGECNNIEGMPDKIVTPLSTKKIIKINRDNYDTFLTIIESITKPSSKNEIISQSDRLIEEVSRRFHGEFYTPKTWADEAHRIIEQTFGINWKDEYVVWDSACGTGNLTRDYQFKELYCSTLYQSDIDIMNQRGYNNEAVKFKYDFLNDDVYSQGVLGLEEDKLKNIAPSLVKTLEENKPIIFFINPPFGSPKAGKMSEHSTKNMTKTKIRDIMHTEKLGQSSTEITIQFLFNILRFKNKYQLSNVHIATFSTGTYLTRELYKNFRKIFLDEFIFKCGFMFESSNFSGVSKGFPVIFNILSPGKSSNVDNFELSFGSGNKKLIYNTDNCQHLISSLRKIKIKNSIKHYLPIGQTIGETKQWNIIENNPKYSKYTEIGDTNFYHVCAAFTAVNCTKKTYVNDLDYYLPPTPDNSYKLWENDSIIYSTFSGNANYSKSKRDPIIENQFFWLSNQSMKQLANDNNFDEMYQDAMVFNQDRFMYRELQKVYSQLSQDAKNVLEKANELVNKTIIERKRLHSLHPEWHLNAWDSGWYQIKLVLKKSFQDDLNDFNVLYKKFEDRMREGVYKFGFLK